MSLAVLIHGCHLEAKMWSEIVLGTPQAPGRILTGLKYAYEHNASLVFWGTGASERGGKKESVVTYELALSNLEPIPK